MIKNDFGVNLNVTETSYKIRPTELEQENNLYERFSQIMQLVFL